MPTPAPTPVHTASRQNRFRPNQLRSMLLAVLCAVVVLAACGSDGTDTSTATEADDASGAAEGADGESDGEGDTEESSGDSSGGVDGVGVDADTELGVKPEIRLTGGTAPDSISITDLVVGDGAEAVAGDKVSVQYVGVLYEDGTQFDASWDRGETFSFALGQGEVISGWDQGVAGMKVGGRRTLVLPPEFAYGANGAPPIIGPDATLVFVVDLIETTTPEPLREAPEQPTVVVGEPSVTELQIIDDIVGDGAEVTAGSTATVHYVGVSGSTGEEFDASWNRGQPFPVNVGVGQVIQGWDEGLIGMKVGGRRTLIIPPDKAYGDNPPAGAPIAPGETLYFVVDLLGVS